MLTWLRVCCLAVLSQNDGLGLGVTPSDKVTRTSTCATDARARIAIFLKKGTGISAAHKQHVKFCKQAGPSTATVHLGAHSGTSSGHWSGTGASDFVSRPPQPRTLITRQGATSSVTWTAANKTTILWHSSTDTPHQYTMCSLHNQSIYAAPAARIPLLQLLPHSVPVATVLCISNTAGSQHQRAVRQAQLFMYCTYKYMQVSPSSKVTYINSCCTS